MNYKLLVVLLFVLLSAVIAQNKKGRDEKCITANDERGKCVPLDQCQSVHDAIGLRNSTAFASKSFCGFDNETAIVCCRNPIPVSAYDEEINNVLGISVCGVAKETNRIHGGEKANIGEFPWVVAIELQYKINNSAVPVFLVGSLINKEYVLTTAHSLVDRQFTPVAVRLGEWDITKDPDCYEFIANVDCANPVQKVGIAETIHHKYYSSRYGYNDIGLIRLEKQVEFTDFVAPICLAHSNVPVAAAGMRMTVAGWGITENGTYSDILLKTDVPIVSREYCREKFPKPIGLNQLCAGGELGRDSCDGDAAAPLMYEHDGKVYQYGIVSSGLGCARKGIPAVYTKVSGYLAWIANVVTNYK